mmetsp:Transcript_21453/g.31764  ORF Transcript_21453/g.31764 Transcript_21453/m.31764 type:complete len:85 (-) Transcript_21453:287-541(-)
MVYINSNGNVAEGRTFTLFGFLKSIITGTVDFFSLFLASITGNPAQIRDRQGDSRTMQRNRVRGSNIRSMKSLGTAKAPAAGGG